jgi:NitT/TauT family transport system permease protein
MATTAGPIATRRRLAAPILLGLALVVLWASVSAVLGAAFVPSPAELAERFAVEIADGDILVAAAETFGVSALGSLLGLVVALPLGYLLAHSRTATAALGPYLAASQAIPAVAFAPLLALWFGYGALPKALLCALLVFFPILLNTVLGISTLDRDVIDAARVDGADRGRLLLHIEGPMALPAVLTGIRNGFVLSVTGAVVGEFVIGGAGLGVLLSIYRDRVDTAGMVATLVVLATLAVVINLAVRGLERMVRWW